MAKKSKNNPQSTSSSETQAAFMGMTKDLHDSYQQPGQWIHARNAVNSTAEGDIPTLSTEQANLLCESATYTIVGAIHIIGDRWIILSGDGQGNSEIGDFDESSCSYNIIVSDSTCLNFSPLHLMTGVAKERFDCDWQIYWQDGFNPDRTMNIDSPPWVQECEFPIDPVTGEISDCEVCIDTTQIDCDKLRFERLVTQPCVKVSRGISGGELPNGSYQVVVAYSINGVRATDYCTPSTPQPLFSHDNVDGSLDITFEQLDENYDEIELVVIRTINQQTSAKKLGNYSVNTKKYSVDIIQESLPSIPIEFLPIVRPSIERSDGMFRNGDYLVRVGPRSKFDFNYQPLANRIVTKWVGVAYDKEYYRDGGSNAGYLRDEVYPLFIRWIYDTGDKTSSYHIPGRPPRTWGNVVITPQSEIADSPAGDPSAIEYNLGPEPPKLWEVYNTATTTSGTVSFLPDGGVQIAEGDMGYWESQETYPQDSVIWNTEMVLPNTTIPLTDPITGQPLIGIPELDLCGKNIRHHKMPDNYLIPHFNNGGSAIIILGLKFANIIPPIDNQGNLIPGIVGYEILRGSREGNKSVIAKGIYNRAAFYNIPGNSSGRVGAYQNYPYNSIQTDDFLSQNPVSGGCTSDGGYTARQNNFSKSLGTFHSPDTQFKHPFLSPSEIKCYGELHGTTQGNFSEVPEHPEHKLITDLSLIISSLAGLGLALLAINGTDETTIKRPSGLSPSGRVAPFTGVNPSLGGQWPDPFAVIGTQAYLTGYQTTASTAEVTEDAAGSNLFEAIDISGALGDGANTIALNAEFGVGQGGHTVPGVSGYYTTKTVSTAGGTGLPRILRVASKIPLFSFYFSEGVDEILRLIKNFLKYQQFATTYQSSCFYNNYSIFTSGIRRQIKNASYLDSEIQDFGDDFRFNNLHRSRCVGIEVTNFQMPDIFGGEDNSRVTIGQAISDPNTSLSSWENFNDDFERHSGVHYVGLKNRLRNQYGQIDGVKQIPVSTCPIPEHYVEGLFSPVLFGGDTYVTRYTEKNTFFYFYDWLQGQPNDYEYDYRLRNMVPYPHYWVDTHEYDSSDLVRGFSNLLIGGNSSGTLPNDFHRLDRENCGNFNWIAISQIRMGVKNAHFYLFNSGVRDFYVESEINTDLRDWGDEDGQRHFDPYRYTNLNELFHPRVIKDGNYYKYDYSLSASRLYQEFASWGNMQPRYYDPVKADTCYDYRRNRVVYSLPQQLEQLKDNWLSFLPNNYKDFKSRVTTIKPIAKNGAMMLFENEAPVQFLGVDQLQTDAGTKITIGDGGLFSQPLQNIINTDEPFEYGSCQNRYSVLNTPHGLFWISRNQGKIFRYRGQLDDIGRSGGLKWWLDKFLPYRLLEDFPEFPLIDNPVAGVGVQTIYDNSNEIVYFCKKDYKLKEDLPVSIEYFAGNVFTFLIGTTNGTVLLGDPRFFDETSWTLSYDPKGNGGAGAFISHHDWHPNFVIPARNHFLTIKNNEIWKHNLRCDLYCNFYGKDYPFEVEHVLPTGQSINTLRSVEYQLEAFKWGASCLNSNHVLDYNFDRAIIYNTEQISGMLNLNISPKNNAAAILNYPAINPDYIDILYSKEEQKYRFNQFWDITNDRGEFTGNNVVMWNLKQNGYIKDINAPYVDYQKPPLQRKKFRHYDNKIWLAKNIVSDKQMVYKLINFKNLLTSR